MSEHELKHYGVIGMKWGVRRGKTAKAYEKASKKLKKLNEGVDKQERKAQRRLARLDHVSVTNRPSSRRFQKAKERAATSAMNYRRRVRRANKWYNAMEKAFKNTDVSLTAEQQAIGKKYADALKVNLMTTHFY